MNYQYPTPPESMEPWNQPRGNRNTVPWWGWVLIIFAGGGLFSCVSCFSLLAVLGANAPATSVCTGNQMPTEYITELQNLGLLEPDEKISYFYSDGLMDIKEGFYFISDRKLVIYSDQRGRSPSHVVQFDEIADVDFHHEESFFIDSTITLELKNGLIVSFPVSSEVKGDRNFYQAVCRAAESAGSPIHTAQVE